MAKIIWNRLIKRKWHTLMVIISFSIIISIVPMGIQYTKHSYVSINETIQNNGRGSYDLLIRPKSSRTDIEKKMHIVEENYIGDSSGGISIKEWNEIKNLNEVEIAAPVASLGYFSGARLQIELPILTDDIKFTTQFYTSDGVNDFKVGDPIHYFYFKERTSNNEIQYIKYPLTDMFIGSTEINTIMPPNYNLLVGIDPESEQKLTNIDYSDLNNDTSQTTKDQISGYKNLPVIKVLQREDLKVSLSLELIAEKIDLDLNEAKNILEVPKDQEWLFMGNIEQNLDPLIDNLMNKPTYNKQVYHYDLSKTQKPFNGSPIMIDENFELQYVKDRNISVTEDLLKYYTADRIVYDLDKKGKISVSKKNNDELPIYKKITEKGGTENPQYFLEQVGTFTAPYNQENILTSSPLGIYDSKPTISDQGKVITPTISPGSFISSPANGITDLEGATVIKGDKPIDAIRVKINEDNNKYTPELVQKIERLTALLLNKGYEVDVVAGSSFYKTKLNVEGIGIVTSPWTSLGVAQKLLIDWNKFNFASTILFLLFGLTFIGGRILFETSSYLYENNLLRTLGWTDKNIFRKTLLEQLIGIIVASILGFIILTMLQAEIWVFSISWVLSILIILLIYILLKHPIKNRFSPISNKEIAPIFFYKKWIYPSILIIFIGTLLLSLEISYFTTVFLSSTETSLGDFVNKQVMIINASILVATIILSLFSINECLLSLFKERKEEIELYRVIGWTRKMFFKKFKLETFLWVGITTIIGTIASLIICFLLGIFSLISIISSLSVFIFLNSIVYILLRIIVKKYF